MDPSIEKLRASDGTGNAAVATVQSTRAALATTIVVDTVLGINPGGFLGTMGTPHTFTDPITSETITVVSEDTAVDFSGHVDGGNLEIDDIAPGYVDNGSEIGDIIIIRSTTQYGDNLADVLDVSHNDDGSLDGTAVRTALNQSTAVTAGWSSLGFSPDTVTALGNRTYSCVFNGTDLTSTVSKGMRLQALRTVTAPTKCTSLDGVNQYYSKSSPSAMTFTDDWVASAWIKLSSYAAGTVVSRFNNTSGWRLSINANGQVEMYGFNASNANYRGILSYQSVPLNKWVHVTAQVDMSTNTATTTTSYVMIDGVDVPAQTQTAGTNPSALIQAGDLNIGADNGGTRPFPGKIAQIAIYNAKVTQANMRATMSQGLTGSETNLISAYSFDNTINDLNTSNANNLTAQNSATATTNDSPFAGGVGGITEFGIINDISFSTDTTMIVQVPEGYALPTTGGISAVNYSNLWVPYGFPAEKSKWQIEALHRALLTKTTPAAATAYSLSAFLTVPIGSHIISYRTNMYAYENNGGNTGQISTFMSDTLNSSTPYSVELSSTMYLGTPGGTTPEIATPHFGTDALDFAAETKLYQNVYSLNSTINNIDLIQSIGTKGYSLVQKAQNAYV